MHVQKLCDKKQSNNIAVLNVLYVTNVLTADEDVVAVCCFTRLVYYVHVTEEIYTVTQLNLAKLNEEPSATYQIHVWSLTATNVNRPHHGDIPRR